MCNGKSAPGRRTTFRGKSGSRTLDISAIHYTQRIAESSAPDES
jgi:hypothetical protein